MKLIAKIKCKIRLKVNKGKVNYKYNKNELINPKTSQASSHQV